MKQWTYIFLTLSLIALPFGFAGIDPQAEPVARVLFGLFSMLFVASLVGWLMRSEDPR